MRRSVNPAMRAISSPDSEKTLTSASTVVVVHYEPAHAPRRNRQLLPVTSTVPNEAGTWMADSIADGDTAPPKDVEAGVEQGWMKNV